MTKVKSRRRVTNARGGAPQIAAVLVRLRRTKQDYEKKERIFYMRPDLSRPRRAFMDQLSLLSCDSRMIRSRFFSQASRSLSALSRVFRIAQVSSAHLEMLSKTPVANMHMTSDEPPNDTNGKVRPFVGKSPVMTPRLSSAWSVMTNVIPKATYRPNKSRAR